MTLVGAALTGCGDSDDVAWEGTLASEAALTEGEAAGSRVVAMGIAADDGLGATAVGPEAPEVTFLEVWDVFPPGGGEVQIARDFSSDVRKRIHLQQAEIAGRCLETRVHVLLLPPAGKRIYTADYFHAGDPAWH